MKKSFLFVSLFIMLAIITGCGNSSKTMICTMSGEIVKGTTVNKEYKVTYTGEYVDYVKGKEIIKSDTKEILAAYKKTAEAMQALYKDIKYYDYNVELVSDTLTSTTEINYAKVDAKKMSDANTTLGKMFEGGKVKLETLRAVYETQGATCK